MSLYLAICKSQGWDDDLAVRLRLIEADHYPSDEEAARVFDDYDETDDRIEVCPIDPPVTLPQGT